MRYFCSFSYTDGGEEFFGNTLMYVQVDPYDDIEEFIGNAYEMPFVATGEYDSRRVLSVLRVSRCKRCGTIRGKVLY